MDSIEFIFADASKKNFFPARCGVEAPGSILADQRYREGKVLLADDNDRLVVAFHRDLVLRVVSGDKFLTCRGVGHRVARGYDIDAVRAEYRHEGFGVTRLGCAGESAGGLVGCLECLLGVCRCAQERRHRQ